MCNMLLITCGSTSNVHREVNKVREMRLRKRRECDRLRREKETSEERQSLTTLVCDLTLA